MRLLPRFYPGLNWSNGALQALCFRLSKQDDPFSNPIHMRNSKESIERQNKLWSFNRVLKGSGIGNASPDRQERFMSVKSLSCQLLPIRLANQQEEDIERGTARLEADQEGTRAQTTRRTRIPQGQRALSRPMGRADPASRLINQYPEIKEQPQDPSLAHHPPRRASGILSSNESLFLRQDTSLNYSRVELCSAARRRKVTL